MKTIRLAAGLLGGASALALVSAATAQTAPAAGSNEIVVTGSRVITNGNNSPTPLTVVQTDELTQLQPTTLAAALNDLPVFSGSRTQTSAVIGAGTAGAGNPASNQLNLRNLGANRNLILFDGQRVPPTIITGVVDVDMVPDMLIQRVDIATGGVSAVYGSDAISGVVNYVTDKGFNGLKLEAQSGISQYGDDRSYKIGVAVGVRAFDGRGHFEASYDRYNDDGVLARTDRPWNGFWGIAGAGTTANPDILYNNLRLAKSAFGGLISGGVLTGQYFATNGALSPFVHGTPTGSAAVEVGGDGAYLDPSLKAPLEYDQAFGRFDYDFSDTVHGHVVFTFNSKSNYQLVYNDQLNVTLSATNAFLPAVYQAQLAAAKQSTFKLGEVVGEEELKAQAREQQYFVNSGLDGKFGLYDWAVDFDYGSATLVNTQQNNPNEQATAAALDAVVNPANGQIVCNVTLTNPGLDSGCVPINVFGPTAASADALRYIMGTTQWTSHTKSYDLNGHLTGEPFSLWAGPVKAAVSGEWRRLTYDAFSVNPSTLLVDCTGLRFGNCNAGDPVWSEAFSNRSQVSQTVKEGAFEANVPLLKDVPLARGLEVNGAVRYTDYDTSGAYWTWKVGLDWRVSDELTLRATQSRDIRAPTLNDLFQTTTIGSVAPQDQLTGLSPTVPQISSGNPNLKAEIGETRTAGLVWRPTFMPGFSFTVDGYYIKIRDAILRIQGSNSQYQNSCYASGGTSRYCALQLRPLGFTNTTAANAATAWLAEPFNISNITTYGADFEANYTGKLFDRRFNLRGFATYQPHIVYTQPATTTTDQGGAAFGPAPIVASPSLRMTGSARIALTDAFTVGVTERWRNAMRLTGDPTIVYANNYVAPVGYTDLNVSYRLGQTFGQTEMFLNIQNLFNANPPAAASGAGPGNGYAASDDPIGRYFTVGVRFKH